MRRLAVVAVALIVVAGVVSAVDYLVDLPRAVAIVALPFLALGAVAFVFASFVEARQRGHSFVRSALAAVKDTARIVVDLVP